MSQADGIAVFNVRIVREASSAEPMPMGNTIAASVALYEAVRQRSAR